MDMAPGAASSAGAIPTGAVPTVSAASPASSPQQTPPTSSNGAGGAGTASSEGQTRITVTSTPDSSSSSDSSPSVALPVGVAVGATAFVLLIIGAFFLYRRRRRRRRYVAYPNGPNNENKYDQYGSPGGIDSSAYSPAISSDEKKPTQSPRSIAGVFAPFSKRFSRVPNNTVGDSDAGNIDGGAGRTEAVELDATGRTIEMEAHVPHELDGRECGTETVGLGVVHPSTPLVERGAVVDRRCEDRDAIEHGGNEERRDGVMVNDGKRA